MFLLNVDYCIDWLRRKEFARKALAIERVKNLKVVNWETKPPKGISAR